MAPDRQLPLASRPGPERTPVRTDREAAPASPVNGVPTITIDGADDPFTSAGDGSAYRSKFTGRYEHQTLPVGHNVPQEAPKAFADVVMRVDSFARR